MSTEQFWVKDGKSPKQELVDIEVSPNGTNLIIPSTGVGVKQTNQLRVSARETLEYSERISHAEYEKVKNAKFLTYLWWLAFGNSEEVKYLKKTPELDVYLPADASELFNSSEEVKHVFGLIMILTGEVFFPSGEYTAIFIPEIETWLHPKTQRNIIRVLDAIHSWQDPKKRKITETYPSVHYQQDEDDT